MYAGEWISWKVMDDITVNTVIQNLWSDARSYFPHSGSDSSDMETDHYSTKRVWAEIHRFYRIGSHGFSQNCHDECLLSQFIRHAVFHFTAFVTLCFVIFSALLSFVTIVANHYVPSRDYEIMDYEIYGNEVGHISERHFHFHALIQCHPSWWNAWRPQVTCYLWDVL